jgi:hypothetical protein
MADGVILVDAAEGVISKPDSSMSTLELGLTLIVDHKADRKINESVKLRVKSLICSGTGNFRPQLDFLCCTAEDLKVL